MKWEIENQIRFITLNCHIEAAERLVYKAVWEVDRGKIEPALASIAKWFVGEGGESSQRGLTIA